jgi:leader peptidase (prepilin peptidase)/N-methyltransferase
VAAAKQTAPNAAATGTGGATVTADPATILLAALLGLAVGSFLNVCIHRLPRGESLVYPPSRCPRCGRALRWHDNIPVLSWIWLGGRCGQCQAPISVQYPIVEVVTAALIVGIVMLTPPGPLLASRLVFACALVVLFAVDLEHHLLPNAITLPGIIVGWLFSFFAPPGWQASLMGILLGAGLLYGTAAAYYLVRREEGLGMGDVKMLAMVGAFLGWKAVLLTLVLASFSGALVGIAMIATSRGGMRYALPFGTFLAVGAVVAMLAGDQILAWYLGFLP